MDSMTLLSYEARMFLVVSLALVCVWAATFYRRQKQPQRLGGRISLAKLAWLVYAVFVWFILCPLLATAEPGASGLRDWRLPAHTGPDRRAAGPIRCRRPFHRMTEGPA